MRSLRRIGFFRCPDRLVLYFAVGAVDIGLLVGQYLLCFQMGREIGKFAYSGESLSAEGVRCLVYLILNVALLIAREVVVFVAERPGSSFVDRFCFLLPFWEILLPSLGYGLLGVEDEKIRLGVAEKSRWFIVVATELFALVGVAWVTFALFSTLRTWAEQVSERLRRVLNCCARDEANSAEPGRPRELGATLFLGDEASAAEGPRVEDIPAALLPNGENSVRLHQ